jgi:hypothetical protein
MALAAAISAHDRRPVIAVLPVVRIAAGLWRRWRWDPTLSGRLICPLNSSSLR